MEDFSFEARVLNTPYEKADVYHSLSMPVYNTAAYEFDSAEDMEAAFCGRTTEHAYSRITNPTVQYFEDRIRMITGAMGVTALNSGMAAISNTLMAIAYSGANIVTSRHLFGNTYSFLLNTKYISGGATSTGGLILDYGTFDWSNSARLKDVSALVGSQKAFTFKMRKEIHRNLGAYMTPQVAYMQTLGIETMSIRFERQAATCLELAKELQKLENIESVNYTGLPGNPYYDISTSQFGPLPGAMLTFNLASREACFAFMNKLKLIRRATNLFDNKTLAIHPASTIYGTFTEQQRVAMDVDSKTIRLSVGLETVNDLLTDIKQALP